MRLKKKNIDTIAEAEELLLAIYDIERWRKEKKNEFRAFEDQKNRFMFVACFQIHMLPRKKNMDWVLVSKDPIPDDEVPIDYYFE